MNENKLREAIRKELKKANESTEAATQISASFVQASAKPEEILYALNILGAAFAGIGLHVAWKTIRNKIETLLKTMEQ